MQIKKVIAFIFVTYLSLNLILLPQKTSAQFSSLISSLIKSTCKFPQINSARTTNETLLDDENLRKALECYDTAILKLERLPHANSPIVYNLLTDSVLTINVSSPVLQDNVAQPILISGALTSIFNGSGIRAQPLFIYMDSADGGSFRYRAPMVHTDDQGYYEYQITGLTLPNGVYSVISIPDMANYSMLRATTHIIVSPHQISLNDLLPYLTAAGIIIGILSFVPRALIKRRERKKLCEYITKIDSVDDGRLNQDRREICHSLRNIRNEVAEIFEKGKINEEQYEILDKKISDYLNKFT